MTRRLVRPAMRYLAAVVFMSSATACRDAATPTVGPLAGERVVVGSQDFTESLLLAQMAIAVLEDLGATVTDHTGLVGADVNRDALLADELTLYPDYWRNGWNTLFATGGRAAPAEHAQLAAEVRAGDRANGVEWVGQSEFSDRFAFAMSPEVRGDRGTALDIDAMGRWLADHDDAVLCIEAGFESQPEGLPLVLARWGTPVADRKLRRVDDGGQIYRDLVDGRCAFGQVYSTDSRLSSFDLTLVDDAVVFPDYHAAFVVRSDAWERYGDVLEGRFDNILSSLDRETMTDLNAEVDNGRRPVDVAREFVNGLDISTANS